MPRHMLIVFDEATGVAAPFWDAAEGMMTSANAYWLVILNPTDPASRAYEECQNTKKWHVMEISALEHPNIRADLAGLPAPFPRAVRLEWVKGRVEEWCTPLANGDHKSGDVEFPPDSGQYHRPGPLFESKVLGLWPTQGSASVWNEAMWLACLAPQPIIATDTLALGCDKGAFWRRLYQHRRPARRLRPESRDPQRLGQQPDRGTLKAALRSVRAQSDRGASGPGSH